jgi:hypothetical protein
LAGTEDVFHEIHYEGDVGRLYAAGAVQNTAPAGPSPAGPSLVDDNFYNGEPGVIGPKRYAILLDAPLELPVLPLRDDAPVSFDSGYRRQFTGKQVVAVASVTSVQEYEFVVRPQPTGVRK